MATPIFCCGFECGGNGLHWTSLAAFTSFSTSTVRSGTRSIRFNPSAQSANGALLFLNQSLVALNANTIVGRFYVRFATLPNQNMHLIYMTDNAGSQLATVYFKTSDSKIYGGADSDTPSGFSVTTGVWYRVDYKAQTSIGGGGDQRAMTVSVDGTDLGAAPGASGGTMQRMRLGVTTASTTGDFFIDDLVLSATGADYPLGAGYVNHFVPTSDGTHNIAGAADFKKGAAGVDITNATTDSYLLIDDIPIDTCDGTAAPTANDYINAIGPPNATDYTENVFGNAPGISTPTTAPRAVEVGVVTAQSATQTGSFKANLNDNGTVAVIKENVGISGAVEAKGYRLHFATPPTGGAWTVTAGAGNFKNLRIRFYSADPAPDQYLVSAMIEAEFAEVFPTSYIGGTGLLSLGVGQL